MNKLGHAQNPSKYHSNQFVHYIQANVDFPAKTYHILPDLCELQKNGVLGLVTFLID